MTTSQEKRKILIQTYFVGLNIDVVQHSTGQRGLSKYLPALMILAFFQSTFFFSIILDFGSTLLIWGD